LTVHLKTVRPTLCDGLQECKNFFSTQSMFFHRGHFDTRKSVLQNGHDDSSAPIGLLF